METIFANLFATDPATLENDAYFKSGQKMTKNNKIASSI
jgi:hypothetical protein